MLKQCGAEQFMALTPAAGSFSAPNLVFFLMPIASHVKLAISSIQKLKEQDVCADLSCYV